MQYSAILYSWFNTVQHSTVHCSAVRFNIIQGNFPTIPLYSFIIEKESSGFSDAISGVMQDSLVSGLISASIVPAIFNRPGVAGAVLQSPPSLIHSLSHPLV